MARGLGPSLHASDSAQHHNGDTMNTNVLRGTGISHALLVRRRSNAIMFEYPRPGWMAFPEYAHALDLFGNIHLATEADIAEWAAENDSNA